MKYNRINYVDFTNIISERIKQSDNKEITYNEILSLFPMNTKTIILHYLNKLIYKEILCKKGFNKFSLPDINVHIEPNYNTLSDISRKIYNEGLNRKYKFYISGYEPLINEFGNDHIPYPSIVVIDESVINEFCDILKNQNLVIITENDRLLIDNFQSKNNIDAFILKGRDFSLSKNCIAIKEKAYIDLYFAKRYLKYSLTPRSLNLIYNKLIANKSITNNNMILSSKDRQDCYRNRI